ncbi:DUF1909-domain-containing protein [Ramicandelaber brevisporus]|nr:DUF1909-domain-containing protein [Ramicandelaber brevisporus]
MPQGNVCRSNAKRERNAKNAPKEGHSQLKVNEKAKTIVCTVCKQTFMCNIRAPALTEHSENKHSKTLKECFPTFAPA